MASGQSSSKAGCWIPLSKSKPSSNCTGRSAQKCRYALIRTARGRWKPRCGSVAPWRRSWVGAVIWKTPLASNAAVTSFADIPRSLQLGAVQIILCDHHYWGGMRQVQHLARLARTMGFGLSMHSNTHLGISLMAMAHLAAATPHLTYACDTHYPWQSAEDEVVRGGRVPIVNGRVRIPGGAGLGVELDYDQLARGRERYSKCPYRKRDDEAQMRAQVDPNWKRILPRW